MVGFINSALPFCLYSFAGLYIPASYSVILNSTSPFFGALFSWIMFKEQFSPKQIGGLILGVVGVSMVGKIAAVQNDFFILQYWGVWRQQPVTDFLETSSKK